MDKNYIQSRAEECASLFMNMSFNKNMTSELRSDTYIALTNVYSLAVTDLLSDLKEQLRDYFADNYSEYQAITPDDIDQICNILTIE